MSMIGSPFISSGGSGVAEGTYPVKGNVDASLASNLPASPADGDSYRISVGGTFEGSTDVSPVLTATSPATVNDRIVWVASISKWSFRESGDDVLRPGENLSDVDDAATARTNLDVYSREDSFKSGRFQSWTNWTIPNTFTLGFPPFTVYDWLESLDFIAAEPFEMMIRIEGEDGLQIADYGNAGPQTSTDDDIHVLVASALTAVTGTSGSLDSVSGTERIVEGYKIRSQDQGDGTHRIWFTVQDSSSPNANRFQIGANFNVATSTNTFSRSRVTLADQQLADGTATFYDEDSLTSAPILVDQRVVASGGGVDQATVDSTSIKYAIALG